jgi:transposase
MNIKIKTIMIEILNPFDKAVSYAACIGVDWGQTENCFQLFDPEMNQVERIEVAADPASMGIFIRELRERFPQGKIGLVSEQSKGALVNQLLDYPFFELMAANPHAAAKFRRSLHPSGSKTDPIDSSALLRMIFTHRDRMALITRGDELTRRLDGISRHRRSVVEQRVEVSNRLESLLQQYYPQALSMLGAENWDLISLAFLRKWPSYSSLMKSKDETLEKFYYAHRSRSKTAIKKRLDCRRASAALSSDPLLEELGEMQLKNYVEQLAVMNKQIQQLDKQLQKAFSKHPDKEIFQSLPGAGRTMAPRLAAAFGCDRDRYKSCSQLQAYSGIAPIKLQSGDKDRTYMRRFCSKFLRQSFHEWAGLSAQYSPWAKACYQMFRERGKGVGKAKRALAFKWIRILFRCWKNKQPYDEVTYVRRLIKHNSPVVKKMKELGFIDDENNILFA